MSTFSLENKCALVSGSGTGIGREIALELARRGADVVVHYLRDEDGAHEVVAEIERLGRRSTAVRADFAEPGEVRRLGEAAVGFLGGLDILVNNAGITWNRDFPEVTEEQFDRLYAVNIRAPFFLTQSCLPALLESRGAVVNITSIHAFAGYAGHAVYAGTKGAVVAWTRELAIELAPQGVRVNAVAPGSVYVEAYQSVGPDFDSAAAGKGIPCGFVGETGDIAKLVAFLASGEARFIVGQTIIADGGTTSWMPFSEEYRNRVAGQFGRGYVPGT